MGKKCCEIKINVLTLKVVGITAIRKEKEKRMGKHLSMDIRVPIEPDNPAIVRNEALCIRCGQCKEVCEKSIGVHGTYRLENTQDTAVIITVPQEPMWKARWRPERMSFWKLRFRVR